MFNKVFSSKGINNNRGIKHDFPFINRWQGPEGSIENRGRSPRFSTFPRDLANVNETEVEARGFQPSQGTLQMLMNDKIMFDHYYCINSTKYCENEEIIAALYFTTLSHFPTRVRYAWLGPRSSTHDLAHALVLMPGNEHK